MKVVLVEGQMEIRWKLKEILKLYNTFEIIEEFDNVNEASNFIAGNEVDVFFINLQCGDPRFSGDGSFLAYLIAQNCPDSILVTYSDQEQSASVISNMNSAAFFMLPFDGITMQRVVRRVCYLYDLLQYKSRSSMRSIMIKTKDGYQLIALESILFIERVSRRTRLVTKDGKEIYLTGYSMEELERVFSETGFYRCYQSFIVNLAKVSCIRGNSETKNYAILLDGYAGEIMLSRDKYNEVKKLLAERYAGIHL